MKKISLVLFAVFLNGCSSAPEQPQPEGKLLPVYVLQHELNERAVSHGNHKYPVREIQGNSDSNKVGNAKGAR